MFQEWRVTMQHDEGIKHVRTHAIDESSAKTLVCFAEGAPLCAAIKAEAVPYPYTLSDFGDSDGIAECEEIIEKGEGTAFPNGVIHYTGDDLEVFRAIDYLIEEWDYSLDNDYVPPAAAKKVFKDMTYGGSEYKYRLVFDEAGRPYNFAPEQISVTLEPEPIDPEHPNRPQRVKIGTGHITYMYLVSTWTLEHLDDRGLLALLEA